MRKQGTIVLLTLILCTSASSSWAQLSPRSTPPPLVRFTGKLLPVEEAYASSLRPLLEVSIKGERWVLRLARVQILASGYTQEELLRLLVPPLHFDGPENLLRSLQTPEHVGQLLAIEGRLYLRSNVLLITAVEAIA